MTKQKVKFKCISCGKCCQTFRDQEAKSNGLPLREWELAKFKELAKKHNVKINIQPIDIALEKRSGLYFCVDFKQIIEPCPFLDKNKRCLIYSERPLTCRMYPLAQNPIVFPNIDLSHFGDCPGLDAKEFIIKNLKFKEGKENKTNKQFAAKEFLEAFGEDAFVSSLIVSWHQAFVKKAMENIVQDKSFKLRKVSKYDYPKITPLTFFDFLIRKGYMEEDSKEKMIEGTLGYERNKEMTYSIINGEPGDKKVVI